MAPTSEAVVDRRALVRRAERHPWNRLHSIVEDSAWVDGVAQMLAPWPVVPNLRCGDWYVSPRHRRRREPVAGGRLAAKELAATTCYFKSTDGHYGNWGFSLKRANLELARLIDGMGGCIIVDSTRRGKSMPDALAKTVPTWCAVLNAASQRKYDATSPWPEGLESLARLRTPEGVVSPSEHAQIEQRLEGFVDRLLASDLPIPRLRAPLRPYFVAPGRLDDLELLKRVARPSSSSSASAGPGTAPRSEFGLAVVLVSASRKVEETPVVAAEVGADEGEADEVEARRAGAGSSEAAARQRRYVYVQGSGDDEESWSRGLRPTLFWRATLPAGLRRGDDDADATERGGVREWLLASRQVFDWRLERLVRTGRDDHGEAYTEERACPAAQGDERGQAATEEDRGPWRIEGTRIWISRRSRDEDVLGCADLRRFGLVLHCDAEPVSKLLLPDSRAGANGGHAAPAADDRGDDDDDEELEASRRDGDVGPRHRRVLRMGLKRGKRGLPELRQRLGRLVSLLLYPAPPPVEASKTGEATSGQRRDDVPLRLDEADEEVVVCDAEAGDLCGSVAVLLLSLLYDDRRRMLPHVAVVDAAGGGEGSAGSPPRPERAEDRREEEEEEQERRVADGTTRHDARLEQLRRLDKRAVQRRLQWLVASAPWATPSRGHLLRVNEALLSRAWGAGAAEGAGTRLERAAVPTLDRPKG